MITISTEASSKIKELLEQQENERLFLRVGVVEGGCSGFNYSMGIDDEMKANDEEMLVEGIRMVVDDYSKRFLNGVIIDYKQSDMGGGFTIDNPNASATCGCGSSFRTATEAGKPADC
jgi:iron-sulfur cluster assembly protein